MWFDDSGKGHGPVFVLAGYLATVEDWCAFADDWKTLLHQGPKPLSYIKGYEAFGFNKQFIGWNETDRDARLTEFLEIVDRYSSKGLAIVIPHDLFDKILKQDIQGFKNPYMFASVVARRFRSRAVVELENLSVSMAPDVALNEKGRALSGPVPFPGRSQITS